MSKYNDIRALADYHAQEISRSPRDWTGYLDTAARLYRYDFSDSLLIHAQRPEATACAELEIWNQKMGRWVNRGAKGIALIDDTGPRKRLRYVFDISDTHLVPGGRNPWLWQLGEDREDEIKNHLMDTYDLDLPDGSSLSSVLMEIARQYVEENLEEAMDGLAYEVKDTFLEDLGEDAVRVQFRTLLENSAYYILARRCGLEPMEELEAADFAGIVDFNRISVLAFLGNAAHEIAEPVLRDIGREIARIEREINRENSMKALALSREKEYNTLKRESENEKGADDHGTEHGDNLSAEGRLPVSESGNRERSGELREVRDAAEELPEGEQAELVSEHDALRETGELSAGDRRTGEREDGIDRIADGEDGRADGAAESGRSDDLGGQDEQYPEPGRGDRAGGIDLQLIEETTEQDLTEAEEEIASALSLPEYPTANAQRRMIEQPMAALYAGEIAIPADVVDEILRTGSNRNGSQLRIIYNFMIDKSPEEYTDFIRREYGKGGKGFVIDGHEYSVWFDELGMQIAVGHTVEDRILDKAFLSWEDVTGRIRQLLSHGEYAPQVVLDAARGNALSEHAQALAYMEGDMAEGVAELVFEDTELFSGGYPEKTDRIAEYLSRPENVNGLVERLEGLAAAYEEDHSVMRFQYYSPDRMLAMFRTFAKETVPFSARDGFSWHEHEMFITQDEIDAFLARGGAYSDGRLAIYSFYLNHTDNKERADFLKDQYGIGGQSHALSGADNSNADYDGKGIRLERGQIGNPSARVELSWSKAAQRVGYLIEHDRFLTAEDHARMPVYERQRMARTVISFYDRLPQEIVRPYTADFLSEQAMKEIPAMLEDPEAAVGLLEKMDAALAELPLESDGYERKAQILSDLHGYVEGSYTIFPQSVHELEPAIEPGRQMSLFDFFNLGREEPAEASAQVIAEESEAMAETEEVEMSSLSEINEPEESDTFSDDEESEPALQETETGTSDIDVTEDEQREVLDAEIEEAVTDAMESTGTSFEDYSPEQMDVIYAAAEKGYDLEPLCNPAFSPEQMQLISDIEGRMEAHTRASFHDVFDFITKNELSLGAINDLRAANNLPLEEETESSGQDTPDETAPRLRQIVIDLTGRDRQKEVSQEPINFCITDDDLGAGGPKAKFRANMDAIYMLKKLENGGRLATSEEQVVLSRFVGWGGIPQAFDADNREWSGEYAEVKAALTAEEYREARASTLNAFYTSPTVIKAMYEALGNMGLSSGNVLEPSCGVGNFMGLVPDSMENLRMYGVELDSISGRIARQLYQKNQIAVQGFETTEFPDSFFDCVIGNVPFGQYKVNDRKYDRYNFLIHDYFIARSLDLTRPGGVVAVVTSAGTMDKQNESVRQYLANRADLIGAIRLPNNAFMRNANTGVVADILFFQKRDRASLMEPDWVHLGTTLEGYSINEYFVQHPEMVLGEFTTENTQYGRQEVTVKPIEGANLADQLHEAISHLQASIEEIELSDSDLDEEVDISIPADPSVKNFSFTNVDGMVYYRENSRMHRMELPAVTTERVLGMIEIRNTVQKLLDVQMNNGSDAEVALLQKQLSEQYDNFTAQYGIISSNANKRAFQQDSSYCLLSSLEVLDEEGNLERKADIFYTIMRYLQYDTLQKLGMGHFDSWAASFGETVTAIELSPEGTGYRAKTRFARFFNLPELISLFKEAADVQTADMLNLPVPEAEYVDEVLEPSEEQKELVSSFADRAEKVRSGGLDPRIDNMLKITNDGRKCALDQRLINDMLPDAPESKVNLCVENAFKVWQDSSPKKGTQLIFCDLSTPKADGTFNVYDDLREKLTAKGIPQEEIVFIHEANTEAKKAELFAKVRAGQVRILIGSTPKLGAGTNVQDRLIALHHLDCPWKPSDLEQQEGRILRQGNYNDKVKIFRYVTEGTFDAYMWQILENKQKFISQIMTSKSPVRACEDVDDTALSYAEIKALATGNPYIKEKMDLDIQVSKLKLMKANHTSAKYRLETDIARTYPVQITATKERIAGLKADLAAVKPILEQDKDHFQMVIGGKEFTDRKEAGTALIAACAGLKAVNTNGKVGEYQGFSLTASFDSFHQTYQLTIKRQCSYTVEIGKDALGNIQRITNALSGIERKLTESEQKLENLQKQLATAQEEVKKPFAQEAELAEKTARLAELNSMLNMDERDSSDVLGIDEDTDVDIEAAEKSQQAVSYAGRVSDMASREAERTAERRPSVLDRLHSRQEQVAQAGRKQLPARKQEQSL